MSKPVRVRRLTDVEGRELQRIVRRGSGKTDNSVVKWRRALVVLASAGGNEVAVIARMVQTSPDRVPEMIHRFNEQGMRSLDPAWAGGRPRRITTTERELIVLSARARPTSLGQRFTRWSIRKLQPYVAACHKVVVSRERLRQILAEEQITFQATKTWKESPDPAKEQKLARIEEVLEITGTEPSPSTSSALWRSSPKVDTPGRAGAVRSGCGPIIASRTAPVSSSPGTRSTMTAWMGGSNGEKEPRPPCGRSRRSAGYASTEK